MSLKIAYEDYRNSDALDQQFVTLRTHNFEVMTTSYIDDHGRQLPRIYSYSGNKRAVFSTSVNTTPANDVRLRKIKLEMAAYLLQETRLKLICAQENSKMKEEDWARVASVMCQSLEVVFDHVKNHLNSPLDNLNNTTPTEQLNSQQIKIIRLIEQGMSNKAIGSALGMKQTSVNQSLSRAYKVLGVKSRTQAVAWCVEKGII